MPTHPTPPSQAPAPTRGFALLVTITLVAFLVLVLVALATLTRVETQVAINSQRQAQARQNALLALNIALGQLQKHTGPDQRVTARADLILPAGVTITPPTYDFNNAEYTSPGTTGAQALIEVESYWGDAANPRNRHWTGAWKNDNHTDFRRDAPADFNPVPGAPVWLVSGSESPALFDPATPVAGLALATTALDDTLRDSANDTPHRLLVGRATTGPVTTADLQRYVTAPQMPIKAVGLPGAAAGTATTIGHYAWWVGDEGVKARADIIDPYAPAPGKTLPSAPDHPDNVARRQSAQRLALEAMTTSPGSGNPNLAGLAPYFTIDPSDDTRVRVTDPRLDAILAASQFAFLHDDPVFRAQLGKRHHDLSVTSRGVLADVKHGGLKRDLTHILGQPDLVSFRSALNASGFNVAPGNTWNIALTPEATPYATIPSNEPNGRAYDAIPGILDYSATWEQLWSYYNMKENAPLGVFSNGSDIADSRPPSGTRHGLHPLLVQAKLFYAMEVNGGAITLRITPVAVLANPYNVPLRGEFLLRFANPQPVVVSGTLSDPPPATDDLVYTGTAATDGPDQFRRIGSRNLSNGGLENITLRIKADEIPPGAAQIFTVDPDAPSLTINGKDDQLDVAMINTFDPSAFITYHTGLSIAADAGHTHAALYASGMAAQLHIGDTTPENRIASVVTKSPQPATGAPVEFGFLVYPLADGFHRGGGVFFAMQDGKSNAQQAMFYQLNYRALYADYIGSSSYHDHPLQWGNSYGVRGLDGDTDTGPHPLLAANHLPPVEEDIPSTTRWGLVASGEFPSLNTLPPEITDPRTGLVNLLYQIPTPGRPVTSIAQLQHLNLAGHFSNANAAAVLKTNSFLVNYPIGNSYPGPRVRRHKVFHSSTPLSHHHDASYIWNDLLWDRFTFSSYPQSGDFDFSDPGDRLVNARYRPFRPAQDAPPDEPDRFRGVFEPAKNLLVEGAFNINSTSVEAWKALFSGLRNIPTGADSSPSAPFPRTLTPGGGSADAANGVSANAWSGFRNLSQDEVNALAEEMVLQVRLRGPFLSMAEFVNRRLVEGPTTTGGFTPDPHRLGLSGALQAAIDKVVNRRADVPAPYDTPNPRNASTGSRDGEGAMRGLYLADLEYRLPTRIAGYPGYLLQADVLSAVGPHLSARSDTFTIRTYGDVVSPATGDVEGRAWCEAVVQRLPDYIVPADNPEDIPAAGTPNAEFGRRYHIVSFRWLSPEDI